MIIVLLSAEDAVTSLVGFFENVLELWPFAYVFAVVVSVVEAELAEDVGVALQRVTAHVVAVCNCSHRKARNAEHLAVRQKACAHASYSDREVSGRTHLAQPFCLCRRQVGTPVSNELQLAFGQRADVLWRPGVGSLVQLPEYNDLAHRLDLFEERVRHLIAHQRLRTFF